jgi:hypothetical protein
MEKGILSVAGLRSDIQAIEREASLFVPTNFVGRSEAIDFLDFHIIDRISGLLQHGGPEGRLELLRARAARIKDELEKIDSCLFEQVRGEIATGMFAGASFGEMIRRLCGAGGTHGHDETGYDQLDAFVNGLFSDRPLPQEKIALMPGMVSFHKTPVRVVFELLQLAEMGSEDLFFDIGSGLGQVVLLVHLISGARARGIEYEPAYCAYASAMVSRLRLTDTDFINADAREVDYSEGTVFFLYTPFEGNMLRDVLRLLRTTSRGRVVRIFTYGPCSSQVAAENWLYCVQGMPDDPYRLCLFTGRTSSMSFVRTPFLALPRS